MIAHSCHRAPFNLWVSGSKGWRDLLGCLADDFQAPHERTLQHFILFELRARQLATLSYEESGFRTNVLEELTRLEGHLPLRPVCGGL